MFRLSVTWSETRKLTVLDHAAMTRKDFVLKGLFNFK